MSLSSLAVLSQDRFIKRTARRPKPGLRSGSGAGQESSSSVHSMAGSCSPRPDPTGRRRHAPLIIVSGPSRCLRRVARGPGGSLPTTEPSLYHPLARVVRGRPADTFSKLVYSARAAVNKRLGPHLKPACHLTVQLARLGPILIASKQIRPVPGQFAFELNREIEPNGFNKPVWLASGATCRRTAEGVGRQLAGAPARRRRMGPLEHLGPLARHAHGLVGPLGAIAPASAPANGPQLNCRPAELPEGADLSGRGP